MLPVEITSGGMSKADLAAMSGALRDIHIVLPAYNEASNLGAVLKALDQTSRDAGISLRAIVVNDGSTDATGQVVRDLRVCLPITLIEHSRNLGLGNAIRTGLFAAVDHARDGDVIVTMDADDTHTPAAIARMIGRLDSGADVIIASRYRPGSAVIGVPAFRRFLSYAASIVFRIFFPIPGVRDFTCGYRAYRAATLRAAIAHYRQEFITQEGFQCMVDILLKLRLMRLRFAEVPLVLRYDRKGGKSKMNILRTAWGTLVLLARRRLGY
jgi:dolichol-phosphate mannosyltransferase